MTDTLHATCIARRGRAALLRGPSASGKSDLAFRFLETYPDAWLIADDQVTLDNNNGRLHASSNRVLKGLLEIRGLGFVQRATPAAGAASVALIVDLVPEGPLPRIAEPVFETLEGVTLPVIPLMPFEVSAPAKLALALETIGGGRFPGDNGLL